MRFRLLLGVTLLLRLLGPTSARATCADLAAVATARAVAAGQCDCATATNHAQYTWCVARGVKAAERGVVSGTNGTADHRFCSRQDTNCDNPLVFNAGTAYDHTFTSTGVFPYFCSVHFQLGMTGMVIVQ